MPGLGVGIMHNTINSKYGPKPPVQADYLTAVACGADSFWVADHLNSVLPPSMWKPKYVGAARVIPKMDAHLEPWTMLGYLAAKTTSAGCASAWPSPTPAGAIPRSPPRPPPRCTS